MNLRSFLFAIAVFSYSSINAQVHQHAIGLRGGSGAFGVGPEISYQMGLSDMNRLEMDLGWGYRKWNNGIGWGSSDYQAMKFSIIYHWAWNITGGLNWYVGPGGQVTYVNFKNYDSDDGFYFAAGGQIGLEYDFSVHGAPLHIGLDYRPMFLFNWFENYNNSGAFSIRYLID